MAAIPPNAHVDGRWQLGGGYTAIVYEQRREPGGTEAARTFEILRDGRVVVHLYHWLDEAMSVATRDITGDGVKEALVDDYTGGSAGCGVWHLYGGPSMNELWSRSHCQDTDRVRLEANGMVTWRAILTSKTKASGSYIHCCWRLWRRTLWKWPAGTRTWRVVTNPPKT